MPRLRSVGIVGAAAVTVAGTAAACASPVARWEMNEKTRSTMVNSNNPRMLNGSIGKNVRINVRDGGRTVYRFPGGTLPDASYSRIVRVPENNRLDPGNRDFVVTVTFKTSQASANLVQKGQSGDPFFKVETHGTTTCLFRGTAGSVAVSSGKSLHDGKWHTIRCERKANDVSMMVDGRFTNVVHNRPTGVINNASPLTIGGKYSCNGRNVTCDFFDGAIDRVQIDAR